MAEDKMASRLSLWVGLLISLAIVAGFFVTAGVWISGVQKDIADLGVQITNCNVEIERIRTEGTRLSQDNSTMIKIMSTDMGHIKAGLDKNDRDHEKIMGLLEKKIN